MAIMYRATCYVPVLPLALLACTPQPAAAPCPPSSASPACSAAATVSATPGPAGSLGSTYNKPPQNVLDVLHAPSPPFPYLNPTRDMALLVSWVDYPPIARVAEPYLRLAGARVEPRNRSLHSTPRGYGIAPCARGYALMKVADGSEVQVKLPAGCPGRPIWSADGKRYAFRNNAATAVELWVGNATSASVQRVEGVRLNPMLGSSIRWMPDQRTLLVKLVPAGQGAPPPAPAVPPGPNIQETSGAKGQSSTYEARDVLKSPHDEALFDYYAASQIALVDTNSSTVSTIGGVAIYDDLRPAPDGQHLLVETIERPYSYVVTAARFPLRIEVWNRSGKVLHRVAQLPLADRVPIHGVRTGPRRLSWRATEPATLIWAEALDGGDWNKKVPARDRVMMHKAPFAGSPVELTRTKHRYAGIGWGQQPSFALLYEYDANRQWKWVFAFDVDQPNSKPRLLWDLSTKERYLDPGRPVYQVRPDGFWVIKQDGNAIYLRGNGSSPGGDRPFLDRFDQKTLQTERLFRSERTAYERFLAFGDKAAGTLLTWHQSPADPPNLFARTLGAKRAKAPAGEAVMSSTRRAITHIPDPTPAVRAIKKRLVKYKRNDGVDLSFKLYLPPGYEEGTRVPSILYAYPLDYASAAQAGQVRGSERTFTRLRRHRLLLLAGYAIIDAAAFPIVGDPKKAYDTYLEQLVANAQAAVDKAVAIGVADPKRIGVTGHSHGALMTVNLLAHSDLFRAGVATSGSYNKTLTAFGFQNERRSVWEARDVYLKVSPFFAADKLKEPLLIMHGEDDANPGTRAGQATKLYEAIRGNGGTARLVMLPHEPHWYSAMESTEQFLYETIRWFDRYVKNAPAR